MNMKKRYPKTSDKPYITSSEGCKKLTSFRRKSFEKVAQIWQRTRTYRLEKGLKALTPLLSSLPSSSLSLPGQPLDLALLHLSPLYERSRQSYLNEGGTYFPSLISSPRTLGSAALLENQIEYSPIEHEYLWAAQDPHHLKEQPQFLYGLRLYISNVFHEQNHRILWSFLPRPPEDAQARRRYLNFIESLVITLDMALGDELGEPLARLLHECGVVYDPGTSIKESLAHARAYRNYLQATQYATYLYLEHFEAQEIEWIMKQLHAPLGDTLSRAILRALRLDSEFVYRTNPLWQAKHSQRVFEHFQTQARESLELSDDPLNHCTQYLWTERWLERMGL